MIMSMTKFRVVALMTLAISSGLPVHAQEPIEPRPPRTADLRAEDVLDFMLSRVFVLESPERIVSPTYRRPYELDEESVVQFAALIGLRLTTEGTLEFFTQRFAPGPDRTFCVPGACEGHDANLLRFTASEDEMIEGKIWAGIHLIHDRDWVQERAEPGEFQKRDHARSPLTFAFQLERLSDLWRVTYLGIPQS